MSNTRQAADIGVRKSVVRSPFVSRHASSRSADVNVVCVVAVEKLVEMQCCCSFIHRPSFRGNEEDDGNSNDASALPANCRSLKSDV
jgi:hypothetical protein